MLSRSERHGSGTSDGAGATFTPGMPNSAIPRGRATGVGFLVVSSLAPVTVTVKYRPVSAAKLTGAATVVSWRRPSAMGGTVTSRLCDPVEGHRESAASCAHDVTRRAVGHRVVAVGDDLQVEVVDGGGPGEIHLDPGSALVGGAEARRPHGREVPVERRRRRAHVYRR